jgi:hypothetical protein
MDLNILFDSKAFMIANRELYGFEDEFKFN